MFCLWQVKSYSFWIQRWHWGCPTYLSLASVIPYILANLLEPWSGKPCLVTVQTALLSRRNPEISFLKLSFSTGPTLSDFTTSNSSVKPGTLSATDYLCTLSLWPSSKNSKFAGWYLDCSVGLVCLGETTGSVLNPARDLGSSSRTASFLFPNKGDGDCVTLGSCSSWSNHCAVLAVVVV